MHLVQCCTSSNAEMHLCSLEVPRPVSLGTITPSQKQRCICALPVYPAQIQGSTNPLAIPGESSPDRHEHMQTSEPGQNTGGLAYELLQHLQRRSAWSAKQGRPGEDLVAPSGPSKQVCKDTVVGNVSSNGLH